MHGNRTLGLFASLILLAAFLSACDTSPSEAEVAEAIEKTRTAEAENQEMIETKVAAALAELVGDTTEDSPASTAAPTGPDATAIQATVGAEVETRVAQMEQDLIQQLTLEAQLTAAAKPTDDPTLAAADGGGGLCGAAVCAEVIAAGNLNVREGPGEIYRIIDALRPGETVPVIARSPNGWLNIRIDGLTGWVSGSFVDLTELLSTVQMAATIPATPRIFPTVTPTPTPTETPSPTATNTPTPTPEPGTEVIVINNSSSPICRLEIYPSTKTSGDNRLADPPLAPGARLTLELTEDASVYDFKAWNCDSEPLAERLGTVIFDGFTWTITD